MKKSKRKSGGRPASRGEVRQQTRRVNVPRASKRPAERSRQGRSRKS